MKSVIIPEEKVRIVTKAIHLVMVLLKMAVVVNKEIIITEIDKKIGFILFKVFIESMVEIVIIFLISFELQNQGSS